MPVKTKGSVATALLVPTVLMLPSMLDAKERKDNEQETMVVVATRTQQALSDVAGSVAVVTSEEMEKQMASNLDDAVRYVPGVHMNGEGRFGFTNFNIRGIEGSRVKVLIDGVEQPTPYGSGVKGTSMRVLSKGHGQIEPDTLTAIEINKSASSALYGSGALGGSVLMRTKNADDLLRGEEGHASIDTGYQSRDNSYKATVNLAGELSERTQGMLIYTHRNGHETQSHGSGSDIVGENRGKADPEHYLSHNVLGKIHFQANKDHRFTFVGEYYQIRNNGSNPSLVGTPGAFTTFQDYNFKDQQDRVRLGVEHDWQADLAAFDSLQWKLNYQSSKSAFTSLDHQKTDLMGDVYDRRRYRDAQDTSWQLDVQMDKGYAIGDVANDLTYGLTLVNSEFLVDSQTVEGSRPGYPDGRYFSGVIEMPPKTDVFKAGLFAQNQAYMLEDRLVLTTGIRYDMYRYRPTKHSTPPTDPIGGAINNYKNHDSSAFTGQVAALYKLTDSLSTFAKYSRGFRAPSPEELYYSFDRVPQKVVSNPDLKPETSDSVELGLRQNLETMGWEVVGYNNDYRNFIDSVDLGPDPEMPIRNVSTYRNIHNARIYGVEMSSQLYLGEFTSLPLGSFINASIAWSKGEN